MKESSLIDQMARSIMTKTCLLLIDVQRGFISDYTSRCIPFIHSTLEESTFDLVVATQFYNPTQSLFREQIHWHKFSDDSDIALDDAVREHSDLVIRKSTYSAGQDLINVLKVNKIEKVVVMGIDTDVCVAINSALLFDNLIPVTIDSRGCATNGGPEAEKAAINMLKRYIGYDFVIE